jgi:hypothetical protein
MPDVLTPIPDVLILVQCQCGAILLRCDDPDCLHRHWRRILPACGVCTATGGLPVWQEEDRTDAG